ncbi:UNVERIFIED_ORG: hypothetical protein FHR35_009088 [Microbispora rosea subsp. rosea]
MTDPNTNDPTHERHHCRGHRDDLRQQAGGRPRTAPIETTEEWFRQAWDLGLAPMTLRLAIEGIAFSIGRPARRQMVVHIPLRTTTYLWVTGAENTPADDLEELHWHIWKLDARNAYPEDEEIIIGDSVSTAAALDIIVTELTKARSRA